MANTYKWRYLKPGSSAPNYDYLHDADPPVDADLLADANRVKAGQDFTARPAGETQVLEARNLLPQTGVTTPPTSATVTASSFEVRARTSINFDRLNKEGCTTKGKLYVQAYADASATGEVRIYNQTDGVQLALISFSETSATVKSADLASIPSSGIKVLTLEIRRPTGSGSLKFIIDTASIDFTRES